MNDTPPRPMPTPRPRDDADHLVYYRLERLENKCDSMARGVDKLRDAITDWRASDKMDMAMAIERCGSHGKRLDNLEHEFKAHASDESTAVVRVVNQEIDRREFQAMKDTPARWGAGTSLILSIIGILAAIKAWLGGGS